MKKTAITLLTLTMAFGAYAQSTNTDAEGRSATASGATRADTAACRDQAREQKLAGKERREFIRNCVRSGGAGSAGASTGGAAGGGQELDAEGRPSLASGATRSQSQACRAEATDKKLAGKERRSFMRDCMKGAAYSGPSGASGTGTTAAQTDAEGRPMGTQGVTRAESKACAQEAKEKNLAGAERRKFMASCVH